MRISSICKLCAAVFVAGFLATQAYAQDPVYHLKLAYETQPTGPNQTFYVRLILVEHTVDVAAYQLLVGFDQAMGHLVDIHNNLGANGSGTGASFLLNDSEAALNGVPYADTSRQILLYTTLSIVSPMDPNQDFNIGRLEFQTSSTYSPAQGQFGIYLTAEGDSLGFFVGNDVDLVDVECESLDPISAVADWAIY